MRRIFSVAVIAAAALTTLGLAAPAAVSAGTSSQATATHIGNLYYRGQAGYTMTGGGWRFRYVATTLTVPAAETRATDAMIWLDDEADALDLWVKAGGGPSSIGYGWSYDEQATFLDVAPNVGDKVSLSIYYDRKAQQATVTAADLTQGTRAMGVTHANRGFNHAAVIGEGPTDSLASSDTRLWAFKDTRLTSFNGTHGTILGPWPTYRIFGVQHYSNTVVVLRPSYPWNNGHNFSIWWRAAR